MKRTTRRVTSNPPWIDGDFYLHVGSKPIRIEAGSRQRAMPCVICQTPAGGQECFLLALVAGLICPSDGSHLGALGAFCHVRCLPLRQQTLIEAVAAMFSASGH